MQTQSLIEEVNQLIARTKAILDETERKQLHHVSLKAIAELRQTYAFMISTAFMLKEDQRSEAEARRREQVEDLKERFNREELELIHRIMTKSPNERLVYIRIEPASPI